MFRIIPLKQAELSVPLGLVVMLGDMRFIVSGPVFVWLIEGGEKKILVDAGVGEQNGEGGEKGLKMALSSVGIKLKDIETLILTHLHFDHAENASLFENAKIYVQKSEWKSAFDPPPHYREIYHRDQLSILEEMDLCLVRGDTELEDGITIVSLPGHTKGSQGVLINTSEGNYLIAGDLFYSYLNLFPERFRGLRDKEGNKVLPEFNFPFLPPGFHVDLSEWYESCFKALSLTRKNRILPGHEPSLEGMRFG